MNFNVTAKCDDCNAHDMGSILGRRGSEAEPLLLALAKGWEALHAGHEQIVVASPLVAEGAALDAVLRAMDDPDLSDLGDEAVIIPMKEYRLLAELFGLASEMAAELRGHEGDTEDVGLVALLLARHNTTAAALGRLAIRRARR